MVSINPSLRNHLAEDSTNSLREKSIAHRRKLENDANYLYRKYLYSFELNNSLSCPHCQSQNHIRYGVFEKRLFLPVPAHPELFPEDAYIIIKIQRFRCAECGITFSFMPKNCRRYLAFSSVDLAFLIKQSNEQVRHIADLFLFRSLRFLRKLRKWFIDLIGHNHPSDAELSCAMDLYEQHRCDKSGSFPVAQSP